jgi:hypothetical protein
VMVFGTLSNSRSHAMIRKGRKEKRASSGSLAK